MHADGLTHQVLEGILQVRNSDRGYLHAYLRRLWTSGIVYTSQPDSDRRSRRRSRRRLRQMMMPTTAERMPVGPVALPVAPLAHATPEVQKLTLAEGASRALSWASRALSAATAPRTAAAPPLPTVYVYELPAALIRMHTAITGQEVLAQVLGRALLLECL